MKYSVTAVKRAKYAGFNRAGIHFLSDNPTVIDSSKLSKTRLEAILSEPMLKVEEIGKKLETGD